MIFEGQTEKIQNHGQHGKVMMLEIIKVLFCIMERFYCILRATEHPWKGLSKGEKEF